MALVTGGSRGIGRAIALRLAAEGADVAVNYRRDAQAAEEVVAAIRAAGRKASAFAAAPYSMAKAALAALARSLAQEELAHGIRVNMVAPGLVATDMGDRLARAVTGKDSAELDARAPFGRVCRPEDVADVVAFLVSTPYVNGERITVDGAGSPLRW